MKKFKPFKLFNDWNDLNVFNAHFSLCCKRNIEFISSALAGSA